LLGGFLKRILTARHSPTG